MLLRLWTSLEVSDDDRTTHHLVLEEDEPQGSRLVDCYEVFTDPWPLRRYSLM